MRLRTGYGVMLVCVLALGCALPSLVTRVGAETEPASVAMAVPDSGVASWVRADRPEPAVGARLKQAGVHTVALGMRSVDSLVRDGALVVVEPDHVPEELAAGRDNRRWYLRGQPGDPDELFERTVQALRAWHGDRVHEAVEEYDDGDVRYVRVDDADHLGNVPVGYDQTRLQALIAADVRVLLALPARLESGRHWLEGELARAQEMSASVEVQALGDPPFVGNRMDQLAFADFLAERGLRLVLDDTRSGGAAEYAERLGGAVLRAHAIVVHASDDPDTLTVRARRAVKERGVRLIVWRAPPADETAPGDFDQVLALADRFGERVPGGNWLGSTPTPLADVSPGPLARAGALLAGLALLAAAGVRFIGVQIPLGRGRRWRIGPAVVGGGFAALGVVSVLGFLTDRQLLLATAQLAAAVAGAVLAVLVAVSGPTSPRPERARLPVPIVLAGRYLAGAGVAVLTGLVLAAQGSRGMFLLGAESFTGVKVLLVAPVLIVAAYGSCRLIAQQQKMRGLTALIGGFRPVHAIVVGLLVIGVAYYLLRSGNTGLAPGFELWLRDQLDEWLYIRPRFAETLLGFPALFLAVAWQGTAGRWIFATLGAVGTSSVVDTFAHFHTPVLTAFLRSAYSIGLGLALGAAAHVVLRWLWRRWRARVVSSPAEGATS